MGSDIAEAKRLEEERLLVERAQSGDKDALRPIFDRYADPLYGGVVLPRLGNTAQAEDVLKDTFLTALEKIDTFVWRGRSIYSWLRQIAVNKVIDVHRRHQRAGRMLKALAAETPDEAPGARPDEQLIAAEERRRNAARISEVMDSLSPRYRTAIRLRLVEERSREECARELDVTVAHFDVILFRAIRSFRKHFGEPGEEPPQGQQ